MLLHVPRALHTVVDRQKDHGIHFRVLAKWLRLAGGDHLHTGTVVGKLEGERETTLGVVDLLREDFVLQFGGGSAGHPQGSRAGATANRVALEACVQARNEGRDLAAEGPQILKRAARRSPELAAALETWREIRFDFAAVDTPDVVRAGHTA